MQCRIFALYICWQYIKHFLTVDRFLNKTSSDFQGVLFRANGQGKPKIT